MERDKLAQAALAMAALARSRGNSGLNIDKRLAYVIADIIIQQRKE